MLDYQLGQTLLIRPDTPFDGIAAALNRLGWQREDGRQDTAPLLEGEPEFATWSWRGHKPFVIYTFNPLVRMRVLDVATLPPVMRGAIASSLPLLDERGVEGLFDSDEVKERLLGLWAAQETERLDLIRDADRLTRDPEPALAGQAREVRDRLVRIDEARHQVLADLRLLTEAAPRLIARLSDPLFVRGLRPALADLQDLFDEDLTEVLDGAVTAMYAANPHAARLEPDTEIRVFAAPAGLLRWANPLSDRFPRGYRDIAGWMNPKRVWLSWTLSTASGGTVRYDGLSWLDGHWVWLPKVYRYLAPYLLEAGESAPRKH